MRTEGKSAIPNQDVWQQPGTEGWDRKLGCVQGNCRLREVSGFIRRQAGARQSEGLLGLCSP